MNTPFDTRQSSGTNTTLWVAVGVLGLAVLGMGATLIRMQTHTTETPNAALVASATVAEPGALSLAGPSSASAPAKVAEEVITEKADKNTPNKAQAHTNQAQAAPKNASKNTATPHSSSQVAQSPMQEPVVTYPPAKPLCTNCGTVESVTPVERDGEGSGVGVVAGGVLGAVVGNQVGGGSGKTLATVLGAVGGGMAGNAVEKKMKKVTHYRVTVRMDDGTTRTVDQATSASVGSQVTVNGNTLSNANR